jgi:hypothetical protein
VEGAGHYQYKFWDGRLKKLRILGYAKILAPHRSGGRWQGSPTGVLKMLTGAQ